MPGDSSIKPAVRSAGNRKRRPNLAGRASADIRREFAVVENCFWRERPFVGEIDAGNNRSGGCPQNQP